METYADEAISIIDELHTEVLDYYSEYLPLISAAQTLQGYENTGLSPEEINSMREKLARYEQAEKEGRIKIIEKSGQFTCGSCVNFIRFEGKKSGTCKVKKYICDRWGSERPERGEFVAVQSHKSCSKYEAAEAENALKERENDGL